MLENRYLRNMNTFTAEENLRFKDFKVCVAGCGGLGGYVIEELGRLGIGRITAIDGDTFDETNLNRQLFSTVSQIGEYKVQAAFLRMKEINPGVEIIPIRAVISETNCADLIKDNDLVVDALDNIPTRLLLERYCEKLRMPLVHGAIAGWCGQVSVVLPGDKSLLSLYGSDSNHGEEVQQGTPAFTPALIASIQVAESIKVLLNRGKTLHKKLLSVNLLEHEYEIFDL